MRKTIFLSFVFFNVINIAFSQEKQAAKKEEPQGLALKLANPVANMVSVPFQTNVLMGVGVNNGTQSVINFQPVIPFTVGKVNIITRTIVPFIENRNIVSSKSTQFGISDINFTAFISPAKVGKIIWGAGPSFGIPSASEAYFGTEQWSLGPSAVALLQKNGWTQIILIRQIWSISGSKMTNKVNQLFINPGIAHNFKSGAGLGANLEITHNWEQHNNTDVYLNFSGSMVSKFGNLPVSFAIGPKIALGSNTMGDWGIRAAFTLVLPKFYK